jgi:hypothetical protein
LDISSFHSATLHFHGNSSQTTPPGLRNILTTSSKHQAESYTCSLEILNASSMSTSSDNQFVYPFCRYALRTALLHTIRDYCLLYTKHVTIALVHAQHLTIALLYTKHVTAALMYTKHITAVLLYTKHIIAALLYTKH